MKNNSGFNELIRSLAEALVVCTLLVSVGKIITDYYLIYLILFAICILLLCEIYNYIANKEKTKSRVVEGHMTFSNDDAIRRSKRKIFRRNYQIEQHLLNRLIKHSTPLCTKESNSNNQKEKQRTSRPRLTTAFKEKYLSYLKDKQHELIAEDLNWRKINEIRD